MCHAFEIDLFFFFGWLFAIENCFQELDVFLTLVRNMLVICWNFQNALFSDFVDCPLCQNGKTVPRSDPINRPKTSQNHLGRYHLPKIWLSTQPFESVKNIRARLKIMKVKYLYSRPPPQKTTWRSVMIDLVGISRFKGLKFLGHANLFVFHGHRVPTSTLSKRSLHEAEPEVEIRRPNPRSQNVCKMRLVHLYLLS